MSQYIVDASIVVQLVVEDTHTAETKVLFKGIESGDRLIIPEFCLLECTNVLWKQVRFNNVLPATAAGHAKDLQALDLTIAPVIGLLPRALEIGLKHQLAVYDSIYIALTEQLGYPLITDDSKQAKAATAEGITLKPVTDFKP
jgi:predicted nucleic acid-binding protein